MGPVSLGCHAGRYSGKFKLTHYLMHSQVYSAVSGR
jgi:hypothetical protein